MIIELKLNAQITFNIYVIIFIYQGKKYPLKSKRKKSVSLYEKPLPAITSLIPL